MLTYETWATQQAENMKTKNHGELLTAEQVSFLAVKNIDIHAGYIGLIPGSFAYGNLTLYGTYHAEFQDMPFDIPFRMYFTIRKPGNKNPANTNYPVNHERMLYGSVSAHDGCIEYYYGTECKFGTGAYLQRMPMKYLEDNPSDMAFRNLMNAVKALSAREQWCKQLRKTETQHIALTIGSHK